MPLDMHFASWLIMLLLGHFTQLVTPQHCPAQWYDRPGGDSCYRFWSNDLKSWDEARNTCREQNGHLLKLDSNEETEWVIMQMKKYSVSYKWWIGLRRNPTDTNSWVWTDAVTRNESAKFISWGSGEPNNFNNAEYCADIRDSLLNDKDCTATQQFICERSKVCQDGWVYNPTNGACYLFNFTKGVDFHRAAWQCLQHENSRLTNIEDQQEQTFLTNNLIPHSRDSGWISVWVAGIDKHEEGRWKWYLYSEPWSSQITWRQGQPDNSYNEDCASISVMTKNYAAIHGLNDLPCRTTFMYANGYVCKAVKVTMECDNGWFHDIRTNKCYKIIVSPLSWNASLESCKTDYHANLASITSKEEMDFLKALLPYGAKNSVWVGAHDTEEEGKWQWTDQSSWWMGITWVPGQPDNWKTGEHCGILSEIYSRHGLIDAFCTNMYPFVCQKSATTITTTGIPTSATTTTTTTTNTAKTTTVSSSVLPLNDSMTNATSKTVTSATIITTTGIPTSATTTTTTNTAKTTTVSSSVLPLNDSMINATSKTGIVPPDADVQQVGNKPQGGDDDGLSGGHVAGIVIGVLASVLLLGLIAYFVDKHRTNQAFYVKAPLRFDSASFQRNDDSPILINDPLKAETL